MLFVLLLAAQLHVIQPTHSTAHSRQATILVEQATSLPPEFKANSLLRIADSALITDPVWKRHLLEDAFWAATRAQLPFHQIADRADSVPTRTFRANDLETLTLQTHAVESLLAIDAGVALRLDEQINLNMPVLSSCSDVNTPDISAYYRTAAVIFEHGFSPKQKEEEADIDFLKQRVAAMVSPSQVADVFRLVLKAKTSREQKAMLLATFAGALEHVSGPDRDYGATERNLVPLPAENLPDMTVVMPSLRAYIVRQSSQRRCADNIPAAGNLPKAAIQFNALAAALDPAGEQYKAITLNEVKPAADDGTYSSQLLWQSPQSRQLLAALQWLHHGNRGIPGNLKEWTLEERSTDEWLTHYRDTLKLLDAWKVEDEKFAVASFCMLTDAYDDLAILAPPGPIRERAMSSYLAFLEQRYADIEIHNLWFTQFRQMLYHARFSKDAREKQWILNSLVRSSNPVIALYAKLEMVLGPP